MSLTAKDTIRCSALLENGLEESRKRVDALLPRPDAPLETGMIVADFVTIRERGHELLSRATGYARERQRLAQDVAPGAL